MSGEDWEIAADAAEALLVTEGNGSYIRRDPNHVYVNDQIFMFAYLPDHIDDLSLVVHRKTLVAEFVATHPWKRDQFPGLRPVRVEPEDEAPEGPLTIVAE